MARQRRHLRARSTPGAAILALKKPHTAPHVYLATLGCPVRRVATISSCLRLMARLSGASACIVARAGGDHAAVFDV